MRAVFLLVCKKYQTGTKPGGGASEPLSPIASAATGK